MKIITEGNDRRYAILKKLLQRVGAASITDFQTSRGLIKDGKFGLFSYRKLYSEVLSVVDVSFKDYPVGDVFEKRQIVIHHSAGWDNARGVFEYWDSDARRGVCTSCAIGDNGQVLRGFDEQFWGHALGIEQSLFNSMGVKTVNNLMLNRQAVQVEICAWGRLTENGKGGYKSWKGVTVPSNQVDVVPFRGFPAYERYTEKQLEALELWIVLNAMRFDIPLDYKGPTFWNVNRAALSGEPGVWGHCSYRLDKTDPYPQPELLNLLSNLSTWTSTS